MNHLNKLENYIMINAKQVIKQITANISANENSTTRISIFDKTGTLINLQDWKLTTEYSLNSKLKLNSAIDSIITGLLNNSSAITSRIDYV